MRPMDWRRSAVIATGIERSGIQRTPPANSGPVEAPIGLVSRSEAAMERLKL